MGKSWKGTTDTTMRIDFFEEYPTEENLAQAALVDFPSTVYLAAHSLAEFEAARIRLRAVNPTLEAAYWPILAKSYWISAFSYPDEIEALYAELASHTEPLTVLLDLELPLLRPGLFVRNAPSFFRAKRLIRKLLELQNASLTFHTAEYPFTGTVLYPVASALGIAYSEQRFKHHRILMWYSSMIPAVLRPLRHTLRIRRGRSIIGLGTIATGVFGNEPILTPKDLENDLQFFKNIGVSRVTIFRLGGLSEEYLSVIKKFV